MFLSGVAITLAVAVVVVWMNRDDDAAVAADTTTTVGSSAVTAPTTAVVTTTPATSAPVVTATVPATTTPSVGRCAGLSPMTLPPGVELIGAPGNFDGLPEPESIMDADSAFLFESAGQWYLGFSLHSGYLTFEPIVVSGPPGFAPEISVWNFDGDDGALVKVERSMLGPEAFIWYFLDQGCAIADAGIAGEDPLQWLDWAGANHTQAFACTADGVFKTEAAESSGGMWEVTDTFYEWTAPQGPGFLLGFSDAIEVPASDPAVTAAGGIDC
jgi:hypothetical protein